MSVTTTEPARAANLVTTRSVELFSGENQLLLDSGRHFGPVHVAYETYGTLSPSRDNAIFICHALTGDAHAAGYHDPADRKPGWWDALIGPGRGLDTNQYFVICANVLGGCQGTTGPSSIDPETGRPYGLRFPFITVGDLVSVHSEFVRQLEIERLLAVVGGSLGGMQVLEWAVRFPQQMRAAVCLASAANLSAQGIAFNAVGRRAISADPNFQNGDYYVQHEKTYGENGSIRYGDGGPRYGLALARMLAHITYLSEMSIEKKFGRRLQHSDQLAYDLQRETEFQIESYLHHQGSRFIERFDANSYLYLTRAMDYFDLAARYGSLELAFARAEARFLITSYNTDWLFPSTQSEELVTALLRANRDTTYLELESVYGHDSFLIEVDQLAELLVPFLEQTQQLNR